MKLKLLWSLLFSTLTAAIVFAGEPAPTRYNAYDGFAPGARPAAMGGAFVAVCNDPSAVYYNPAGLSEIERSVVGITYEATRQSDLTTDQIFAGEALQGRSVQSLAFVTQKGAFSWRPLSNSSLRVDNGLDWNNSEVKINAYTISASHKDDSNLSTGINLTYLSGLIAQSKVNGGVPFTNISDGYGFAMDLGFLYTPSSEIRLGMNLKNLAGYMWWDDFEKEQLPFIMLTGIDFQIKDFTNFSVQWEKRYYKKADEQSITHFGLEQWLGKTLALRGGISGMDLNDREKTTFSAGLGYMANSLELSLSGEKYRIDKLDVYRYVINVNIPI